MAATKIPTVGIFHTAFPRDPVQINIYLEHVLVGQILEPLVECGQDGIMRPAVAKKWEISPDGLQFHFWIDPKSLFSNGNAITARDVIYTLQNHLNSSSQSKAYLHHIEHLESLGDREVVLKLKRPYVALLKALSRDHVGIVPFGWKFISGASEPYIASGAYRAVREHGAWKLKINPFYRDAQSVPIREWKVLLQEAHNGELPDLVPSASSLSLDSLMRKSQASPNQYSVEAVPSFTQASAWWYPHGKRFDDADRRKSVMCMVEELVSTRVRQLGLQRANGLIPQGIAGHSMSRPTLACSSPSVIHGSDPVVVAAFEPQYEILFDPGTIGSVQSKFGTRIKLIKVAMSASDDEIKKLQPDVMVFGFAGGFQDPEGFITVLPSMLQTSLEKIFGSTFPEYSRAASEMNWDVRSEQYRSIDSKLVHSGAMVPGWKPSISRLRNSRLVLDEQDLRYSAKLKDYRLRKE